MESLSNFIVYTEIISALFASFFYFKYKNTPAKLLPIILWSIAITELLGWVMAEKKIFLYQDTYSYWLYNLMFPIWNILYMYIFYKTLETLSFKKWVKRFIMIYIIAFVINWLFIENFLTDLEGPSRILGSMLLVISAILYLIELLKSEKIILFHKKLLFWISIGILIFYSGTIPFILAQKNYSLLSYVHQLYMIIYILGSIMYLIFTFGFIWSKKE